MIDLCKQCPNIKCTKPCQDAYKYMVQDTREDRRGHYRKLIYGFDMERFPDKSWEEGFLFTDGAFEMGNFVALLTPRQLEIWQEIGEWIEAPVKDEDPRGSIAKRLGISRWTLNWELRLMRDKLKQCVSEGL